MSNVVVLGTQWGDEGKGKIVDALAQEERFEAVARYQGGDNAGHTVVAGGRKHAFHLLPSGILYPDKTCVIGNGVIINPRVLLKEIERLESEVGGQHARLLISEKAHLIMPWHTIRDGIAGREIGTTRRGIGPCYADYVARRGIRWSDADDKSRFATRVAEEVAWNGHLIKAMLDYHQVPGDQRAELGLSPVLNQEEIVDEYWRTIGEIRGKRLVETGDVSAFLDGLQSQGKGILFEGAQATLLDIAHGTYPFVTSSNPTIGGVYTGTGFRPRDLRVVGVAKAYTTRVGAGPFPTELSNEIGDALRESGQEFGTTTGRPRRCGWLDLPMLKYARITNGLDALAITKLDVLTGVDPIQIGTRYHIGGATTDTFSVHPHDLARAEIGYEQMAGWTEDISQVERFEALPEAARDYVARIEGFVGLPVPMISVGPGRSQLIHRQ